jgi:hypothetical protein
MVLFLSEIGAQLLSTYVCPFWFSYVANQCIRRAPPLISTPDKAERRCEMYSMVWGRTRNHEAHPPTPVIDVLELKMHWTGDPYQRSVLSVPISCHLCISLLF